MTRVEDEGGNGWTEENCVPAGLKGCRGGQETAGPISVRFVYSFLSCDLFIVSSSYFLLFHWF